MDESIRQIPDAPIVTMMEDDVNEAQNGCYDAPCIRVLEAVNAPKPAINVKKNQAITANSPQTAPILAAPAECMMSVSPVAQASADWIEEIISEAFLPHGSDYHPCDCGINVVAFDLDDVTLVEFLDIQKIRFEQLFYDFSVVDCWKIMVERVMNDTESTCLIHCITL